MDMDTLDSAKDDVLAALRRSAAALGMDLVRTTRDADAATADIGAAIDRSSRRVAREVRDDVEASVIKARSMLDTHPAAVLSGAAAIGLLVGLLLPRR